VPRSISNGYEVRNDTLEKALNVEVSRPKPSRLTDCGLCQADMNIDVIETLVVDENVVLCTKFSSTVLLAIRRAVWRRDTER
jgi:hypothetical protein